MATLLKEKRGSLRINDNNFVKHNGLYITDSLEGRLREDSLMSKLGKKIGRGIGLITIFGLPLASLGYTISGRITDIHSLYKADSLIGIDSAKVNFYRFYGKLYYRVFRYWN